MKKGYVMTISDYLEIVELAKANGKKQGDSMQEELEEVLSKKENVKSILLDDDIELLKGNLRENGYHKILDLRDKGE